MNSRKLMAGLAAAAALLASAGPAGAVLVEYRVSGTIAEVTPGLTDIVPGDAFELSAVIETATVDLEPDPVLGLYALPVQSFSFTVGTFTGGGDGSGSQIQVIEDPGLERLEILVRADPPLANGMPGGFDFTDILIELQNDLMAPDPGALGSDALGAALDASVGGPFDLVRATFGIGPVFGDGARRSAAGSIASVETTGLPKSVPEPDTLPLMAVVALAGLRLFRRRAPAGDA